MALTDKDLLQINQLIQSKIEASCLKFKIVQELPNLFEKNTLYFLQISVEPRLFELYHSDMDGDVASLTP